MHHHPNTTQILLKESLTIVQWYLPCVIDMLMKGKVSVTVYRQTRQIFAPLSFFYSKILL